MKILVVDDDIIVVKSCTRILAAEGFDVLTVSGAQEALDIMKKHNFDLLLVDVKMPMHDGLFLLREIRKDFADIPIVIMSGYSTPETIADAYKSGANQFIPKPFRPDELMKLIRQVQQKISMKQIKEIV